MTDEQKKAIDKATEKALSTPPEPDEAEETKKLAFSEEAQDAIKEPESAHKVDMWKELGLKLDTLGFFEEQANSYCRLYEEDMEIKVLAKAAVLVHFKINDIEDFIPYSQLRVAESGHIFIRAWIFQEKFGEYPYGR